MRVKCKPVTMQTKLGAEVITPDGFAIVRELLGFPFNRVTVELKESKIKRWYAFDNVCEPNNVN